MRLHHVNIIEAELKQSPSSCRDIHAYTHARAEQSMAHGADRMTGFLQTPYDRVVRQLQTQYDYRSQPYPI